MWTHIIVVLLVTACSTDDVRASSRPDYAAIRERTEAQRVALARELDKRPKRTLARAREVLVAALRDDILPAWDGTAWAMNGTSQVPQEGKIACGYFVTTTLVHAGFQLERARLGQQASQYIIDSLVTDDPIRRSSDQPIDAFISKVRAGGDGIYLVGLDSHVGFIIVDGEDTWFHHSGPGSGVRREPARTASFLSPSRYRVVAKLFDDALVEKWLRGTPIPTMLPRR